jgi:hypothetical protein
MAGSRLSGIASRDGQWLYSVYVRPDKSAFVHALSLEDPFALCIDLPGSGYSSNPDEFHWSLAVNAAGMAGAHSPTTFSGAAGQPLALIRVAAS